MEVRKEVTAFSRRPLFPSVEGGKEGRKGERLKGGKDGGRKIREKNI